MFRPNDQIGPYILISKLGRGAFGTVWLAERRSPITTTRAALKIPLDDDVELETIRHEANLWVRASGHTNVLPIIEANIYEGQVVIASEYAPDGSLESWLKQNGNKAPSVESAIDIMSGILAGLEYLHSQGIIHRDLKPANILFQGNTPRLTDFGISRVLNSTNQSSTVAGTPVYMAPEAFDGKRNKQTDIWSAGVIFYQLLAGRLPFPQTDITALIGAILKTNPDPLPLTIPIALQRVVSRMLAKDPEHRFGSSSEIRSSFRSVSNSDLSPSQYNIAVQNGIFTVNDRIIQFPTTLMDWEYFFGKPARRKHNKRSTFHIWDDLGLMFCAANTGDKLLTNSLRVFFNTGKDFSSRPRQSFKGLLTIDGVPLDKRSTVTYVKMKVAKPIRAELTTTFWLRDRDIAVILDTDEKREVIQSVIIRASNE